MSPRRLAATIIALPLLAACGEDPPRRQNAIDEPCQSDGECGSSFCYVERCLAAEADDDGDGLSNRRERELGSDPLTSDTDRDGAGDWIESGEDAEPPPDSDADGRPDLVESSVASSDGDCIPDQLDSDDTTAATDPAVVAAAICRTEGLCAQGEVRLLVDLDACADQGAGAVLDESACDYSQIGGFQQRERSCDGLDNDCDGATDEPLDMVLRACDLTNAHGTCVGAEVCVDGAIECEGRQPAAEVCNGLDDDCDGATDPVEVLCTAGTPCEEARCEVEAQVCAYDAIPGCCGEGVSCPPGYGCDAGVCTDGDLVHVPGGPYSLGCDLLGGASCPDAELPLVEMTVADFAVQRTEVTRADYQACVDAGICGGYHPDCTPASGPGDLPASCVRWADARSYCQWQGLRLCSEAEWEKAARGDQGLTWPWGEAAPTCALAVMLDPAGGCEGAAPQPVGSKPEGASPYGALDLAGNVWEWTRDCWHESYGGPEQPGDGSAWITQCDGAGLRVVRGGGYASGPQSLRATTRGAGAEVDAAPSLGFRCCQTVVY